jgi:ABC-type amino acid transport system permease subunit
VLLLLALNILSVKAFGELEFWLAIIKVIAIISLIALGIYLCITGFVSPSGVTAHISNLWSYGGLFPNGVSGLLGGLQTAIFAFAGMEIIGTMMAETKDPERMLPDAIHKIPFRIMIFYIGTVMVLMMVTPWVDISPDESPFVGMFSLVGMVSAASLINGVVIGFTLNVAAYNAAYLKTAFNGLDKTQLEAARAQGFKPSQVFRLITLPQVLRTSVPALTNQVIGNLKDSSITFLIQYTEFFARMQELASTNFQFFKAYLLTALVYLLLVSVIVLVARMIERRVLIPIN